MWPYAYLPGHTPHPTRDPDGHSYAAHPGIPEAPDPGAWHLCSDYLYGIDLFNYGFYWEAPEAWEGLWVACGRRGLTATFLQALINLAAAGFKARWGSARGMRANAGTALRLFDTAAGLLGPDGARFMGLDVRALAGLAGEVSRSGRGRGAEAGGEGRPAFDVILTPEG